MFKYMKYEIKGTYKFILGILTVLLIAITGIQLYAKAIVNHAENNGLPNPTNIDSLDFFTFLQLIFVLAIMGAAFTAFFYIISQFRKELYEDRGYLTFTLPLSGNQIVGSKLLVAMLWYFVLGVSVVVYGILLAIVLFGSNWISQISNLLSYFKGGLSAIMISGIISGIVTLLLIYFSITLSKVSIKNKKIGGIWFILFLILNSAFSYLNVKVNIWLPLYMDLKRFRLITTNEVRTIISMMGEVVVGANVMMGLNPGDIFISIPGILFTVLAGILIFLGTSYLLERKIDL